MTTTKLVGVSFAAAVVLTQGVNKTKLIQVITQGVSKTKTSMFLFEIG